MPLTLTPNLLCAFELLLTISNFEIQAASNVCLQNHRNSIIEKNELFHSISSSHFISGNEVHTEEITN